MISTLAPLFFILSLIASFILLINISTFVPLIERDLLQSLRSVRNTPNEARVLLERAYITEALSDVDLASFYNGRYYFTKQPDDTILIREILQSPSGRYKLVTRVCGNGAVNQMEKTDDCSSYPDYNETFNDQQSVLYEASNRMLSSLSETSETVTGTSKPNKSSKLKDEQTHKSKRKRKNALLAITTSNQVLYTLLTVDLLWSSPNLLQQFDVVVIDDFSADHTVDVLRRKGLHVITNKVPKGLTYAW
jgi:hypothetical protein